MSNALYNEIEPFACDWLERLVERGHIGPGRVERRSITELTAADVAGPGQRHFFAGIGGWSYALRLAGVPDDADVWTGSCPCQPFSSAGSRSGFDDPRHLWPAWFALIHECRPPVIFGEQVAGPDGFAWLDAVCADLEGCGYAVGAAILSAAGVGAPHQRHRIYFVAYTDENGCKELGLAGLPQDQNTQHRDDADRRGPTDRMADANQVRRRGWASNGGWQAWGSASRNHEGLEWIDCADGNRRPIKPGLEPLVNGVSNRVALLAGSGNAIVPQVAATFIRAAIEARSSR